MNEEKRGSQVGRLLVNIARAEPEGDETNEGSNYRLGLLIDIEWMNWGEASSTSADSVWNRKRTKQVSFFKSIAVIEGKTKIWIILRITLAVSDWPVSSSREREEASSTETGLNRIICKALKMADWRLLSPVLILGTTIASSSVTKLRGFQETIVFGAGPPIQHSQQPSCMYIIIVVLSCFCALFALCWSLSQEKEGVAGPEPGIFRERESPINYSGIIAGQWHAYAPRGLQSPIDKH